MIELDDLGGSLPEQDVDDLARAELLAPLAREADHGGQELLGGDRAVPRLRRRQAGVAVAAGGALLAEILEKPHAAALDRLAEGEHGVEVATEAAAVGVVALGGVDHLALLHDILEAVGQPGRGGQAVAPGTAGLLVVALDGLGQVEVGDEAHVGLVDAHAEGDGRDHDDAVLAQEARLVGRAGAGVEPRVVRQRGDAVADQELGGLVDRGPRQAVDDARLAGVLVAQELDQLAPGLALGGDAVLDVGAVEARHEMACLPQVEPGGDLGVGGLGGGGGERDAGDVGPALVQHGEGQVVGPEVVPPLGHAVGLVDREQGDRAPVEQPQRGVDAQALGGEVEQVELARQEGGLDPPPLVAVLRGVEEARAHAEGREGVDLVLHEGDQG